MITRLKSWLGFAGEPAAAEPAPEVRGITWDQAAAAAAGLVSEKTLAGVSVTEETALGQSPVFCAVRVISTSIATLPLVVYRRAEGGGREREPTHPVYKVLHDDPNREQTPVVFWSAFVARMLLHGYGAAEIETDEAGNPLALWLLAGRVDPMRDDAGELFYRYHGGAAPVDVSADRVFYVPYFTLDGTSGKGIIQHARETIGTARAVEGAAASYFANMIRPAGAIVTPPGFPEPAKNNIRESIKRANAGYSNVGRLMHLEDGVKFEPYNLSNSDAQLLQARQFTVPEVARFFNISPTKLADLGRATWSNIESENQSFIENTLRPPLVGIEQEARKKLLSPADRERLYAEHLVEARLRGRTADRYSAYETGIRAGFLKRSEVRQWENLPFDPELDKLPAPSTPAPTPEPKPNQEPTADEDGDEKPSGSPDQ